MDRAPVVWITGASSGIGAALAVQFGAIGAHLILTARRKDALDGVSPRCTGAASTCVLPADLAVPDSIPPLAQEALSSHGRIDIMVHNAGVALRSLAADTRLEVDRLIMEVNYFAPVAITKLLLPGMLQRGSGHFVVISSLSAIYGAPMSTAYAASKHALHGFFESLRTETRARGIYTSIIVPGFIRTDITLHALKGDGTRSEERMEVMENGMSPERCARQIVRAVQRRKEFATVGGAETLSIALNRVSPSLVSWLMRNHPVARLRKLRNLVSARR
jgi:short-subunit dehydrogenase